MFKVNEYFDGKVKSIGFNTGAQSATVGVMAPGEYTFNTGAPETMRVVSGALGILLAGDKQERTFKAGESFDVPGNSSFRVRVAVDSAYLCLFG